MTTDITELAQSLKAEDISSERMEWLNKLADMEYCASNPGHWLMNLKETNYLASLALQCLESNSTLVEALEKAQQEAEELSKFKEVMTSAADALKAGKPLNLESLFKGELASAMFAMMFAGEFVRSGATNYLELLYDVPKFGEMTVTLQKVEGKTPGQRIAELESRTVTVKLPTTMYTEFEGDDFCREVVVLDKQLVIDRLTAAGIKWEDE